MQYLMLDTLVCFLLLGSDTQMYSLLMEITNFSYSNFLPLTCQIEKKKVVVCMEQKHEALQTLDEGKTIQNSRV